MMAGDGGASGNGGTGGSGGEGEGKKEVKVIRPGWGGENFYPGRHRQHRK